MIYLCRYYSVLPPFLLSKRSHQILFVFLLNPDVFSIIHIVLTKIVEMSSAIRRRARPAHAEVCVHACTHLRFASLQETSICFFLTIIYISGHANEVKTNEAPLRVITCFRTTCPLTCVDERSLSKSLASVKNSRVSRSRPCRVARGDGRRETHTPPH